MSVVSFLTDKNLFYPSKNSLFDESGIVIWFGGNIYLVR